MASDWRVIGASVQGAAHQKVGLACQDAHAYRVLPNGMLLVAVADGAGSAERSEAGAQRAVMAALDALEGMAVWPEDEVGWSEVLAEAFSQAQRCLDQFAESESLPSRAFATTLTCVAASEAGLAVGQLGDGVAVAGLEPGELFIAAPPQRGEYANETYFL
ncbi:MAG: PP2C family serine/threonine-protein phosphatase, partial [Anaerolineales bacterium]